MPEKKHRAPSLKRLGDAFPQLTDAVLKEIRAVIHARGSMGKLDKLLENHGVESIVDNNGNEVALYSNSGDSYAPMLLLDVKSDNIRLTTMGDFVEAYQRRHGENSLP